MPLSNDNPEYLMTNLYVKKNWGVIGVSGNAGGIDEKQIDLCKECTCKLNHFLSDPDVTETYNKGVNMTSPSLAYQDAMNGIAILYDELAYAENELDKLKNPWIKCSERMPELDDKGYSDRVLALNSDEDIIFSWVVNCDWEFGEDITHWMPLPELPKN